MEGAKILDTLAKYDLFQLENNIKPDYCNSGGLEIWDGDDDIGWCDWCDEEIGITDPQEYLDYISKI